MVGLIEDITHQLRQVDNALLGLLGVDVDKGMDVVEGVHEEVRMQLITELVEVLLEVYLLEVFHLTAGLDGTEVELNAQVGAYAQEEHHQRQDVAAHEGGRHMGVANARWLTHDFSIARWWQWPLGFMVD